MPQRRHPAEEIRCSNRAFHVSRGNHSGCHLFMRLTAADSALAALSGDERGTDTLTTLRSSSQGVDSSKAHSRKLRERSANSNL